MELHDSTYDSVFTKQTRAGGTVVEKKVDRVRRRLAARSMRGVDNRYQRLLFSLPPRHLIEGYSYQWLTQMRTTKACLPQSPIFVPP